MLMNKTPKAHAPSLDDDVCLRGRDNLAHLGVCHQKMAADLIDRVAAIKHVSNLCGAVGRWDRRRGVR